MFFFLFGDSFFIIKASGGYESLIDTHFDGIWVYENCLLKYS